MAYIKLDRYFVNPSLIAYIDDCGDHWYVYVNAQMSSGKQLVVAISKDSPQAKQLFEAIGTNPGGRAPQ